jgi:hypothetical protein
MNINKNITYRKIISCKNITKLKITGNYLLKTNCKRVTKVVGRGQPLLRLAGSKNV